MALVTALLISGCGQSEPGHSRVTSVTSPTGSPWTGIGAGWTELPSPPEVRDGAAYVWTGDELLAWGGVAPGSSDYAPTSDGYAFDPATTSWTSIPPSPLPGKYAQAAWTGGEAIFFGVGTDQARWQGEAFDPGTETWRVISQTPLAPRGGDMIVWTGQELIVWGGGKPGDPANTSGAAYDPSTDSWRMIANAPIELNQGNAVWTGHEMLVFGSLLNDRNIASTQAAVGAEYDPATDTWYPMPPSGLSPQADSAVWIGGNGLLAWDYDVQAQVGDMHAQAHDGASNTWGDMQQMPLEPEECYPDSTVVTNADGTTVFAWYCGQAAIWDSVTGDWQRVHGGVTEPRIEANGGKYALYRFANLVAAGDVVVLPAEGVTTTNDGEPCYGCPGAPSSLWAYRPPSDAPTPAELAPPTFAPANGWNTISTSTDPRVVDPEVAPTAWAANVPFDPGDWPATPPTRRSLNRASRTTR